MASRGSHGPPMFCQLNPPGVSLGGGVVSRATIRENELVFVIVLLYCYIVMYLVFVYLCIYHVLHLPYRLFVQVTVCVNSC